MERQHCARVACFTANADKYNLWLVEFPTSVMAMIVGMVPEHISH